MNRKKPIKPSWEMTTEELEEIAKEFDEEFVADRAKPMSPAMRARWKRAKAKSSRMTFEHMRKLYQARPFMPFTIYLADGRSVPVMSSEFLSFSPSGRTIIVHYGNEDDYSVIDLLLVTELAVQGRPGRKKAQ